MQERTHGCRYASVHVCMCVRIHACIYPCIYTPMHASAHALNCAYLRTKRAALRHAARTRRVLARSLAHEARRILAMRRVRGPYLRNVHRAC